MRCRRLTILLLGATALAGCTSTNLGSALGTLKNPNRTLSEPQGLLNSRGNSGQTPRINPFIQANYNVLLEATNLQANSRTLAPVGTDNMRRYLGAGFALSDIYCDDFLRDADESQRRRRFGRGVTSDTGTAITTILGLANAGENIVAGVAAGFGLGDKLWRNYDDAFLVSTNLSNVRGLVLAAQDNFRERTLGANSGSNLPSDYGSAQSVILRYANFCSTLGIQALLAESASQQRAQLNQDTVAQQAGRATPPPPPPPPGTPAPPAPAVTTPAITSNSGTPQNPPR